MPCSLPPGSMPVITPRFTSMPPCAGSRVRVNLTIPSLTGIMEDAAEATAAAGRCCEHCMHACMHAAAVALIKRGA